MQTITDQLALKAELPDDEQDVVKKLQAYAARQTTVSSAANAAPTTVKGRVAVIV